MKRWFVWSLTSVATFLVGTGFVYAYLRFTAPIPSADRIMEVSARLPESPVPPVTFLPEFRDLPNFDEYVEEKEYKRSPGKLIDLFGDGIYRRSEVVAKTGEEWLLLTGEGTRLSLVSGRAKVKKLRTNSWPGDELDARLRFTVRAKPVIALRDLDLRQILRQMWHAEGDRGIDRSGDRNIFGSLLWVGDLDRDGHLDLYFDEFNEKGFINTELHLSTLAEPGNLVGLAADFSVGGC